MVKHYGQKALAGWRRILLWLVVLVGCVLWQWPANWLGSRVNQDVLYMDNLSGSLWQGRAGSVVVNIEGYWLALGDVQWQWVWSSLPRLAVCVDTQGVYGQQRFSGRVCRHLGGALSLQQFSVELPAASLATLSPLPAEGLLSLDVINARIYQNKVTELQARAGWQDALVTTVFEGTQQRLSLGSYGSDWQVDSTGTILGRVFDVAGPISLTANIRWPHQQELQLQGVLQLRESMPAVIFLLELLGARQQGEEYQVDWPQGQ